MDLKEQLANKIMEIKECQHLLEKTSMQNEFNCKEFNRICVQLE